MKKYKVLKPVSDSRDNHKYYAVDSTIKLDKARADVLIGSGTVRELTDQEAAEDEATAPDETSKEDKSDSVTKEDKSKGKTKAQ